MNRRIACFHVPELEIALARQVDSRLKGRPAAIAPKSGRSPVVWEVSAEARENGVSAGMPVMRALRLCPDLCVIAADSRRVARAHRLLGDLFEHFSPAHEATNTGDFYLDLSEAAREVREAAAVAARIQNETERRHGLKGTMGVAVNKLVSHVAAENSETGAVQAVVPGAEKEFLGPFPLMSLPGLAPFLAPKTNDLLAVLQELRLTRICHFAAVSAEQLRYVLGSKARLVKQWTLGIDPSPVWPLSAKPVLDRWVRLGAPSVEDDVLLATIYRMVERVCRELRQQRRSATRARLVLQYSDGRETIKTAVFAHPTRWEAEIYRAAEERFLSIGRRVGVRTVGFLAETAPGCEQLDLFGSGSCDPDEQQRRLSARKLKSVCPGISLVPAAGLRPD